MSMHMIEISLDPQTDTVEIEKRLLGVLMVNSEYVGRVAETIYALDFYKVNHILIFSFMKSLKKARIPINVNSMVGILTRHNMLDTVGGKKYIAGLADYTYINLDVMDVALTIRAKSIERDRERNALKISFN